MQLSTQVKADSSRCEASVNGEHTLQQHCPDPNKIRMPDSLLHFVQQKVHLHGHKSINQQHREELKLTTFSNWEFSDHELVIFLKQMFIDLNFVTKFHIDMNTLTEFLLEVYRNYNRVPFHNFKHCFMVAQMAYALIWMNELWMYFSEVELMSLLVACICHDLDHPGLSNYYQKWANTVLAEKYNNQSILENHHLAMAFRILSESRVNIFSNLSAHDFTSLRESIVRLILATDMARHQEIVEEFHSVADCFDFKNVEHKELLLRLLIKVSDVSNEARPFPAAERWIDCLLTEFFDEARLEKSLGINPLPNMDPDLVEKAQSQCGFIKAVALPLSEILATIFPKMQQHFVVAVQKQLEHYSELLNSDKN